MPRTTLPAGHVRCAMCRASHPTAGEPIPRVVQFTAVVDGVEHLVAAVHPFGNQWNIELPDGSRGSIVLFGVHTMEALACGVRHALTGPHPYQHKTPRDGWRVLAGLGAGIHQAATHPAAVIRYARVRAAYRRVYQADTDHAATVARQRDEAMRHTYATPADPHGDDHRARRYLAAYAAILADMDEATAGPVYPVETRVVAAHVPGHAGGLVTAS